MSRAKELVKLTQLNEIKNAADLDGFRIYMRCKTLQTCKQAAVFESVTCENATQDLPFKGNMSAKA